MEASEWMKVFKQKFGRKPEFEEFLKAKSNGFEDEPDNTENVEASGVAEDAEVSEAAEVAGDTEAAEAEEVADDTGAAEAAEVSDDTEVAEAVEASEVAEDTEVAEASEVSEDAEAAESGEAAEDTDSTEVAESTEIAEVAESTESTESTESSEAITEAAEPEVSSEETVPQSESSGKIDFFPRPLKERWLSYFEEVKGRKPTEDELAAAERADFDMGELEAEAAQNTEYLHAEEVPDETGAEASAEALSENSSEISDENPEDVQKAPYQKAAPVPLDKPVKKSKVMKAAEFEAPNSRKGLKIAAVIVSCLAFVVIVGLIFFGYIHFSRDNQLVSLRKALESENADKIAKVVQVADPKFKVSAESIKPFVDYLSKNPAYASELSSAVENDAAKKSNSDVYVVRAGSQLLLYPRYVLKMNLVYPEITAERSGTTVTFDGKELGKTTADDQTLKPGAYVPGSYELKGAFTLNEQTLSSSQEIDLTRFSHDAFTQNLALEFKITAPTVRCSTFPDADVWIDNKKVGQLTDGLLYLPEMAYTSGMEIYLKKAFPSKTIESSRAELIEGYPDITLNFKAFPGNVSDYKTVVNNFLYQYYKTEAGLTQNPKLNSFLEKGASTPDYSDYITSHFDKIKTQNDTYNHANINEIKSEKLYKFDGYYYKDNQDADISLADITDSELVFNVNFSETQYWNLYSSATPNGARDGDGYQLFHWTGRQIIINSSQAENLLNNSSNYDPNTGYIKIRSFGKAVGDSAVNNPNINWNSLY